MTPSARSVMIMAGGTGGHVYPGLAVAKGLRARGWDVSWIGTARGLEARVVPANDIVLHTFKTLGLRGKGLFSKYSLRFLYQIHLKMRFALNPWPYLRHNFLLYLIKQLQKQNFL